MPLGSNGMKYWDLNLWENVIGVKVILFFLPLLCLNFQHLGGNRHYKYYAIYWGDPEIEKKNIILQRSGKMSYQ